MLRTDYCRPGDITGDTASWLAAHDARIAVCGAVCGSRDASVVVQGDGQRATYGARETGVGKSRLIRELAHEATAGGAVVLYGVCDPELAVPYQPVVAAPDHLFRHTDAATLAADLEPVGGELVRLFPDLSAPGLPTPATLSADPETARHRLHRAVSGLLINVSHRYPLVLVLDDLQWADGCTMLLLRHLVRAAAARWRLPRHRPRPRPRGPRRPGRPAPRRRRDPPTAGRPATGRTGRTRHRTHRRARRRSGRRRPDAGRADRRERVSARRAVAPPGGDGAAHPNGRPVAVDAAARPRQPGQRPGGCWSPLGAAVARGPRAAVHHRGARRGAGVCPAAARVAHRRGQPAGRDRGRGRQRAAARDPGGGAAVPVRTRAGPSCRLRQPAGAGARPAP